MHQEKRPTGSRDAAVGVEGSRRWTLGGDGGNAEAGPSRLGESLRLPCSISPLLLMIKALPDHKTLFRTSVQLRDRPAGRFRPITPTNV